LRKHACPIPPSNPPCYGVQRQGRRTSGDWCAFCVQRSGVQRLGGLRDAPRRQHRSGCPPLAPCSASPRDGDPAVLRVAVRKPSCYSWASSQDRPPSYCPWPQPLVSGGHRPLRNFGTSAAHCPARRTRGDYAECRGGDVRAERVAVISLCRHVRCRRWMEVVHPPLAQRNGQAPGNGHNGALAPNARG